MTMLTAMRRMSCGNCAHSTFEIYAKDSPHNGLWIKCFSCMSVTEIWITPAKLVLDWPDEEDAPSDGILCFLRETGKD